MKFNSESEVQLIFIVFLTFVYSSLPYRLNNAATAADLCENALGMEEGQIPDHAITASSSYELKSVGPQNARIRQEKNGGAWCPKAQISKDVREFIEIDLNDTYLITATETQGRFGNGQGQEYAENFLIEYWRPSLNSWIAYKDSKGGQVLTGNVNTYLVVRQKLELPFVATKVRFIPFSEHPRTVCMRVELFGCLWNQHLRQYSIPRPSKIRDFDDNDLDDLSFDGQRTDTMLLNGLGQLVDGVYADQHNYGNQWVGWSNKSLNGKPLNILFEFDRVLELSEISVHVNNLLERTLDIFAHIEIFYGLTRNEMFENKPIRYNVQTNKLNRKSTEILRINMKKVSVKLVSINFHFSRQWILISEFSFDAYSIDSANKFSHIISLPTTTNTTTTSGNADDNEDDDDNDNNNNNNNNDDIDRRQIVESIRHDSNDSERSAKKTPSKTFQTKNYSIKNNQLLMGLIMGLILVVFGIVMCTMFLMVRIRRKKVSLLHKHTAFIATTTAGATAASNHNGKSLVSIDLEDLKRNLSVTPILTNGTGKSSTFYINDNNYNFYKTPNGTFGLDDGEDDDDDGYGLNRSKKLARKSSDDSADDSDNSSMYHEPYKLLNKQPQSNRANEIPSTTLYAKKDKDNCKKSKSFYTLKPFTNTMRNYSENFYATTDLIKVERTEQNFTPGIFTSIKLPTDGYVGEGVAENLLHFPRHRLKIVEKIGENNFGMVHLCEIEKLSDMNGLTACHKKQFVIVKSLWRNSTEAYKNKYLEEIWRLSTNLKNDNFARVLGVCTQDEPVCSILEHSEFGELPKYFQLIRTNSLNDSVLLNYDSLVFISYQVASGMQYLESINLLHRDLAARNCIIGKGFKTKISDHAMYCEKFQSDYYVNETGARLPVRWMSWENLLMGNETIKSDVWSFAVLVWEIFSFCTEQPFAELTDEQVIENCNRWYQKLGTEIVLKKPSVLCSDDIYDTMLKCWSRKCNERPTFYEIVDFFNAKNTNFLHFNH